jgi:hypothetical protein
MKLPDYPDVSSFTDRHGTTIPRQLPRDFPGTFRHQKSREGQNDPLLFHTASHYRIGLTIGNTKLFWQSRPAL